MAQFTNHEPHAAFDPREATISSVHDALFSGSATCRSVTLSFVARIAALNPTLNAIISLNRNVLDDADALDAALLVGNTTGALFCVPVLLKDNFDAVGMATTAGCLALAENRPSEDAPTVAALRREGAVILGKANMHELALEGLSVSSLGGQTLNPYDLSRTPGGSSGGSGAAVAASLAVLATGTDTMNSLRSPASANGLLSMRPTRGLVSRTGIVPVSFTQDAAGIIARSVSDLAVAMEVMASVGLDDRDNSTSLRPVDYDANYYAHLTRGTLKGVRLGLLEGFFDRTESDETTPVNDAMHNMVQILESAGASIVLIKDAMYDATLNKLDVQKFEYREEMDKYLQQARLENKVPQTLNDLYSSEGFLVIPSQYEQVNMALMSSTSNKTYKGMKDAIQGLKSNLEETFMVNQLDALIYPEQKSLVVKIGSQSQSGRNGMLAALTGLPVVTIPIGFSRRTSDAPEGIPIGMEILARSWSEKDLLRLAYEIEQRTHSRRTPTLAEASIELGNMNILPEVVPNRSNIPEAYPGGKT